MATQQGLFIVLEGIDGSGTTTQCELLVKHWASMGHALVRTREPGGTLLAEKIRTLLLDPDEQVGDYTEMLLYAACRAQHVSERIAPALRLGKTVVSDRFVGSSLAYQGYGRGLGIDAVWQVNRWAVGSWLPDLNIYLEVPGSVARGRRQMRGTESDRLEREGEVFLERVAQGYRELASQDPGRWVQLDGTRNPGELAGMIRKTLLERWPNFPGR